MPSNCTKKKGRFLLEPQGHPCYDTPVEVISLKDIPIFPTQYGVASLILREIPYRQEAYIRVQDVQEEELSLLLSECADFCKMSKVHFSRFFKQITGMPPVQFVLKIRIDRAKELLDFTDKPIAEIAEASGFPDQNYFARTFKKITGMSPTQYRNVGNRI